MHPAAHRAFKLAALTAGLLLCAVSARAGGREPSERLELYQVAIATGDPAGAVAFLRDGEARELAAADPARNAALLGKAEALKDLKDLLAMPWDDKKVNQLNQALAVRIDAGKPLSELGVGPEPEKVLAWLGRFQPAYPASRKKAVQKAIREWEVVFGTMTDTRQMSWSRMVNMRDGTGVQFTRAAWERMTLRERNTIIDRLMMSDPSFLIYNDERLSAARQDNALNVDVRALIASLPQAQQSQLAGRSFSEQLYLLGNMFDRSEINAAADLRTRINAARPPLPQEVLPAQERALLGDMLNSAVAEELCGTRAGDTALGAFRGGLRITVAPLTGAYSRYDAESGSVVLDSETIQQYMRIKGYTASSIMSSREQVAEIARYMSPAVVYEAAHKMQADWAAQKGVYMPRTQENEIEAMSLQGLYTAERMRGDADFRNLMTSSRDVSSYSAKVIDVGTEFESRGSRRFATAVRQRYFPGLPSLDGAASQALVAVTSELERRASLPAAQAAQLDRSGLTLEEALEMSPEELASSAGEIRTSVLAKIQGDLSNLGAYRSRFSASERRDRKDLKSLEAGAEAPRPGAPPKPV